jgi:hypothetical protein
MKLHTHFVQHVGPRTTRLALLACGLLLLVGCGGGGASGTNPNAAPAANAPPGSNVPANERLMVHDVNGAPIEGAVVVISDGATTIQATTGADGYVAFGKIPESLGGWVTMTISASGFETDQFETKVLPTLGVTSYTMRAIGAWSIGRAMVLGTDMVERSDDGSTMIFSVDLALIDANSDPIETLTSPDFSLDYIDCGWGGPRDCASDAAGNATHNWRVPEGGAIGFELHPAGAPLPYMLAVLVERSAEVNDWSERGPALRSLFAGIGGNDVANLASVETLNGVTKLTRLGPFTSDGSIFFPAIDELARPAGDAPVLLPGIETSIERLANAEGFGLPEAQRTVLVLSSQWTTVADVDAVTAAARAAGVHISTVAAYSYGLPEMAARTGGFAAEITDPRALGMVFRALDRVLSGTMPFYRMQFRLEGQPGTFVAGGNAKIWLRTAVPASMPSTGVVAQVNVALD